MQKALLIYAFPIDISFRLSLPAGWTITSIHHPANSVRSLSLEQVQGFDLILTFLNYPPGKSDGMGMTILWELFRFNDQINAQRIILADPESYIDPNHLKHTRAQRMTVEEFSRFNSG